MKRIQLTTTCKMVQSEGFPPGRIEPELLLRSDKLRAGDRVRVTIRLLRRNRTGGDST